MVKNSISLCPHCGHVSRTVARLMLCCVSTAWLDAILSLVPNCFRMSSCVIRDTSWTSWKSACGRVRRQMPQLPS